MNYILSILFAALMLFGATQANNYDSFDASDEPVFGATSYPAALDTLTNPNPTDSVATVSHSAQHSNANDAIEAIQAKLGISASTATANSFLVGNGAGSSIWTTYPTTTSISAISASTTNLTAFGSTTLQNFTFVNATGTQATTTNLAVTTITDAIPYANANGSFRELTVGTGLSLSGGTLTSTGGMTAVSTTSVQTLSTTTIGLTETIPDATHLEFTFHASSTAAANGIIYMIINGTNTGAAYSSGYTENGGNLTATNNTTKIQLLATDITAGGSFYCNMRIINRANVPKMGDFICDATGTGGGFGTVTTGSFHIATTSKISSISICGNNGLQFSSGTYMDVIGF